MTFKAFASNVVPGLSEVRFYEDTVEKIKAGHPEVPIELPSLSGAVGNAIAFPTRVEQSYGNSVIFIDDDTTNAAGEPLLVPVKIIEGTNSGRVRSVYFSGTKTARPIIWRKS